MLPCPAGQRCAALDHGELIAGMAANDPQVRGALARASQGEVFFEIEVASSRRAKCLSHACCT